MSPQEGHSQSVREREKWFNSHLPNLFPSLTLQSLFMPFTRSDFPGIFPFQQENCWEGISLQKLSASQAVYFPGCFLRGGSQLSKA